MPPEATALVERYAEQEGWRLTLARAGEFDDSNYLANPVNRCFFCKSNLYDRIRGLTSRRIASGANLDDLGDYRPGLQAAQERGVVHPLVEAGIDKATVRLLARSHGLADLAELPAQPCLASRIETGIRIDANDLDFVRRVEAAAREKAGSRITVRCRITRRGVVLELADVEDRNSAEAACAEARSLTMASGRRWLGERDYRRGSAFVHNQRTKQ
ncbi:adenine nucleotide alpha hydrolase [Microbaculum sp. FT89]|uniref:adenine nucleotide alpha hydrolase n=1 Tax=Microbaculum sp. FT89 TaxID=3447298 RepID=UPI003F5342A3